MSKTSYSVLIADDIPYVRKTLKQILSARGFRIVGEAENGIEAAQVYQETHPDFVLMDLVMPAQNGVEATKTILKFDPLAKIIILSAMMQESLVTEAILVGAKDYVVKPFQTDELFKVIEQVLEGSATETRRLHAVGA